MTDDIGQSFLDDTNKRLRHLIGQRRRAKFKADDQFNRRMLLAPGGQQAPQRGLQPLARQWAQALQDGPDAVLHLAGHRDDALGRAEQARLVSRALDDGAGQGANGGDALRQLIVQQAWPRVLVFVATQYATEHIAVKLRGQGLNAEPFHGQLSQGKRDQVLLDFKAGRIQVVVATDLAGRGIDIAQLPAVVNFDLPSSSTDYLHRIGRTGRAGESGLAVSFVVPDSEAHFRLIEKRQNLRLPREQVAGFEALETAPAPIHAATDTVNGGIKGKRPSKKDKLRAAAAAAAQAGGEG